MSDTQKPSVKPKPINVFFVWYAELCRRLNCNPVPAVRPAKPKCQTVLDFVGDRLKVEEWIPVLNALRNDTSLHVINIRSRLGNCQFLHDVDTEEKAKSMKRKCGSLWTAFVLKQLLKSLSQTLRNTQVLTCLELDGLPVFAQYLEMLLQALKKNKTVKSLSLTHCSIKDIGCQLVCSYLRFTPNVEILNLSDCGLTSESGSHLAKLIKYQQINRSCESWRCSLRYENPESVNMLGLKRITLNCNPLLGDEGLGYILEALEDDLWIKALDFQKCGITDSIANKIIEVLERSKHLEIFDIRQNDHVNLATLQKILHILKLKSNEPEYNWCNTTVSIAWNAVQESNSKLSHFSADTVEVVKSKSAPIKNNTSRNTRIWDNILKKAATTNNVQLHETINTKMPLSKNRIDVVSKQIEKLNQQLQEEIRRRKEIEKKNQELEQRLEQVTEKSKTSTTATVSYTSDKKLPPIIDVKCVQKNSNGNVIKHKNGIRNGNKMFKTIYKNGVSTVFNNGFNNACKIFEKLMTKGKLYLDSDEEEKYEGDAENGFKNSYGSSEKKNGVKKKPSIADDLTDITASQLSLIKFMDELKSTKEVKNKIEPQ